MEKTNKSASLPQKVSSLKGQLSALMLKVIHLKECDLYMTKIIKASSEQLSCQLLGAPAYACRYYFVLF
jgi:hypothetical protein